MVDNNNTQENNSKCKEGDGLCELHRPTPNHRSFIIVTITTLILLMGATIPTPLYGIYRSEFALSQISITLIYAAYSVGVVPTLFFFGPLGDAIGRKPLLILAVVISIIGTAIIGIAPGLEWLIIGRLAQGVGIGAVLGNATAALVELEPQGNKQRASQVASMALLGGLGLGPLIAGLMAQYLSYPTLLPYILEIILLLIVLILVLTIKGGTSRNITGFNIRRPTIPNAKWSFISASLASAIVLAMSGLYFSLAPSYAQNILSTNNIAVGGSNILNHGIYECFNPIYFMGSFPHTSRVIWSSFSYNRVNIYITNQYLSYICSFYYRCYNQRHRFWYNIYGCSKCYKQNFSRR